MPTWQLALTVKMEQSSERLQVWFKSDERACWRIKHNNKYSGLHDQKYPSLVAAMAEIADYIVCTQY